MSKSTLPLNPNETSISDSALPFEIQPIIVHGIASAIVVLKAAFSMMLRSSLARKSGARRRIKSFTALAARALINHRQTLNWVNFLHSTPLLTQLLASSPRLFQKIYWPYLTKALQCQDRLNVLITHYRFVEQLGWSAIVARAALSPQLLGTIEGKTGQLYEIRLAAASTSESEGELILQLWRQETLIYGIAFSILKNEEHPVIGVGCLQGPSRHIDGLELIQQATRDLHGLRPKNLMVRLLQQFGRDCGCNQLILVSNQNMVVQNAINKSRVHADYDTFWLEVGAIRSDEGDFFLGCEQPLLNLEEIASKKRSEAKKRAALLASAQAVLSSSFKMASSQHDQLGDQVNEAGVQHKGLPGAVLSLRERTAEFVSTNHSFQDQTLVTARPQSTSRSHGILRFERTLSWLRRWQIFPLTTGITFSVVIVSGGLWLCTPTAQPLGNEEMQPAWPMEISQSDSDDGDSDVLSEDLGWV